MTSPQPWQRLHSSIVFHNQWCQIRQDTVKLPNNRIIDDYFVTIRPDVALIVPITPEGSVLLVRQYRHGVAQILLELPAGHFDPSEESPEKAAKRELQEETGYTSDRWQSLGILYDNPPKDTNSIHLFLAQNITQQSAPAPDITEEIETVLIPTSQIIDYIKSGELRVAGTIAALLLALLQLHPTPFTSPPTIY